MEINLFYEKKFHIFDPDNYSITKFSDNPKEFYIQFSTTPLKQDEKKDIFSKSQDIEIVKKYENDTIMVNIPLPKTFTIFDLRYVIAYILEVHVECIDLNYKNYLFDLSATEMYEKNSCINNINFDINISKSSRSRVNNYDKIFMPLIMNFNEYVTKSTNKIRHGEYMVTEINYLLYCEKIKYIDIIRFFNINNTISSTMKLCLHSYELNNFKSENRNDCYVKSSVPTSRPLQGLNATKNECVVFYNQPIRTLDYVRLYNISFMQNGLINLQFKIFSSFPSISEIDTYIESFIKNDVMSIFINYHLDECIYDTSFEYFNYEIFKFRTSVYAKINTSTKLTKLNIINSIPYFQMDYLTNSSMRESGLQTHEKSAQFILNRTLNISPTLQQTSLQFHFYSTTHVTKVDDGLAIEIRNSSSLSNIELILDLIYAYVDPLMKIPKELTSSTDESIDEENVINIEEKVMEITEKYKLLDQKFRVKQLKDADPVLFGNRDKNGESKDYSQLVQLNEQRPSPITENEYFLIKQINPNAVLNLRNQSSSTRLYLYCPFDKYPIINYHAEKDQVCVVKCTMGFANPIQYRNCDRTLDGINNHKTIKNRYTSNTIVKFDPSIDDGRRCELPEELIHIFPNCFLLKREGEMFMYKYLDKRDLMNKFVLFRRFPDHYEISNDYSSRNLEGFCIVMLIEDTDDYFVICDIKTNEPYLINKKPNLFVQQIIEVSKNLKQNTQFVRYINFLTGSNFPDSSIISEVVETITKEIDPRFVLLPHSNKSERINKIIYKKKIWSIPEIYNLKYKQSRELINLEDRSYPYFYKDLDLDYVSRIFINKRREIVAVIYNGIFTNLDSREILKESISIDVEVIDEFTSLARLEGYEEEILTYPLNGRRDKLIDANNLFTLMINVYIKTHENIFEITLEDFKKFFTKNIDTKTEIFYIEQATNNEESIDINKKPDMFVSWRKSRISSKFLANVDFGIENIMKIMYEYITSTCQLKYMYSETIYKAQVY